MNEIKCPNCGQVFKVDESGFADIVQQIRDHTFEEELRKREDAFAKEKDAAIELAVTTTKADLQRGVADKETEIAKLKVELDAVETAKKLAVNEAVGVVEKERDALKSQLREQESTAKLTDEASKNDYQKKLASRDTEIADLKARMEAAETEKALAVKEAVTTLEKERNDLANGLRNKETEQQLAVERAVNKVEKERDALASELKAKDAEKQLLEATLNEKHLAEIKSKDEMIAHYKDMKAKLSTKMLGETLEQHCETQFNQI